MRGAKTWEGIRLAFEFLVLTATRSTEVRLATWREVDLVSVVWTIVESTRGGIEKSIQENDELDQRGRRRLRAMLE